MRPGPLLRWLWLGLLAGCVAAAPPPAVDAGPPDEVDAGAGVDPAAALCRDLGGDGGHPDWAKVVTACDLVLKKDPKQLDAQKARQLAQLEVTQRALMEDAKSLGQKGDLKDALARLLQVTAESVYYAQARTEAARLLPDLTRAALATCVGTDGGAGTWDGCQDYGALACFQGWDHDGEQAFRALRLKAGVHEPFECASPLATLVAPLGADAYFRRQVMIKKDFTDPALAALVTTYAEQHARAMAAVRAYRKGKPTAAGRALTDQIAAAVRAYQAAFELMNQGDLEKAATALGELQRREDEFMPVSCRSEAAQVLRGDLVDRQAQKSMFLFEKKRLPESFAACARAHALHRPTDPPLHCMQNLENKAALLLGGGCVELKLGAAITQADSPLHAKLVEKAQSRKCK